MECSSLLRKPAGGGVWATGEADATMERMKSPASSHLRSFALLSAQTLVALAVGLLGSAAWAAPSASGEALDERLTQACSALDVGDLDGAARHLRTLRENKPGLPEARVLEALLTLRRERPALGWHEAFIQAWNDAGRPDLRDSKLLPMSFSAAAPPTGEKAARAGAAKPGKELLLELALEPNAARGRFILQHLRELELPELIFAADYFLEHESLPAELRSQASQALRSRLSELTVSSPRVMQYPALLLLEGSSPEAPFTAEELRALEAIAALPDWRETDFHVLYQHALSRIQATGHAQPEGAAFSVAVSALALRPTYLLYKRTEASREMLSQEQLDRLGEALWRMGSRLAEESTLLEQLLATRMMANGAELVGDEARAQQASALRDEANAAAEAMRQAVPERWPLRAFNLAHMDALTRDELGCMFRFLPPEPVSN